MHHEFPKYLYHANKPAVVVNSKQEQDALGKGWQETPVSHVVDKGDSVDYKIGGQVADVKTPIQDNHATEKTGADAKFGADEKSGVKKNNL